MLKVPFGEKGLKVRAVAALFGAGVGALALGGGSLDQLSPGLTLKAWLAVGVALAVLFARVYRSDDEGNIDITLLPSLIPYPLMVPALGLFLLVAVIEDIPRLGSWRVLDSDWSGSGLFGVLLLCVVAYNLLRLNLQRLLRSRR